MNNVINFEAERKKRLLKQIEKTFNETFDTWRYLQTAELENKRFRDEMAVYSWPGFNGPDVA